MKKLIIVGFSAALLAGGVTSCKKTSKGKMANEWSVSAYTSESKTTSNNGDVNNTTKTLDGTTLKTVTSSTPNGGTTTSTERSLTVDEFTYTIEKDGTWKRTKNTTYTGLDSTYNNLTLQHDVYNVVEVKTNSVTGVWNFIGKSSTEEFKKNERVIFNVLTEDLKNSRTEGTDPTVSSSDSYTYVAGQEVEFYTVVESKSKELQLMTDTEFTNVDENGTFKWETSGTLTLTQK
jgi:hypothetical protein